jgi:serine/threonine protein kinase
VPGCPNEETLLAFLHGALGATQLGVLDQHLDSCASCRALVAALVDVGPRHPASPARARTPAAPPALAEGTVLAGRYRIGRFIGRGGMGEVYEAQDQLLHERVALKALAPALIGDEEAIRRLKREVLLARRISDPHVCRIFDFGQAAATADRPAQVFLTMELLVGETLRARLRAGGRLTAAAALPLVAQMSAGLEAAHRAGVIHRDFKSDNVLVCGDIAGAPAGDPTRSRVVVTDFGLARGNVIPAASGKRDPTTVAGTVIGTTTHAAPEQLQGLPVTPAADVHALGVVLYEMVTGGLLPFAGRTPLEAAERRLRHEAPSPRRLVPDLDPTWEAVILRCLAREPGDRFPSAAAVTEALAAGAPPPRRTRSYGVS